MQYTNLIDIWILFWYTIEVVLYFQWVEEENMGMMLSVPPSKNHQFF